MNKKNIYSAISFIILLSTTGCGKRKEIAGQAAGQVRTEVSEEEVEYLSFDSFRKAYFPMALTKGSFWNTKMAWKEKGL